jgi:diguanylate cyclase (GGDEF)-like protein/PAS domain S-box-containing protein
MGPSVGSSKQDIVQANQNENLYNAVKFSALGSIVAAYVLFSTFEVTTYSYLVCGCLYAVYTLRWLDSLRFKRDPLASQRAAYWRRRFTIGALSAALVWSSTMWLMYPADPGYQCLLVLTLTGVAGGSLASLSYDRKIPLLFQVIIFVSVELRLLIAGDPFSLNIAYFSIFIFIFLVSCSKEVSANFQQLLRLRLDSEEHNKSLIRTAEQIARVGYWQWDMHSDSIELSENLARMWGFESNTITLSQWMSIVHPDDITRLEQELDCGRNAGSECAVEFRLIGVGSSSHRVMNQITRMVNNTDGVSMLLGTVQDITNIKTAEQKIYRMAYYDELTGLSNRAHFHEQLKTQIALATRLKQNFAVVYVDLDDFKGVNDSYGHEIGDSYLRIFSEYVRSTVRASDIAARLGGDEFCIVLHDVADKSEAARITEHCMKFGLNTLEIGNHRIQPKMSVGVSLFPEDGITEDELLKSADMAMYSVKQNGKHGYRFFESSMVSEAADRVMLEASLRVAIDSDQFELWYQPKVDLDTYQLAGVEALIRWRHPERGLIPPDLFIATAERVGMINEIGDWVLETACRQLQEWHADGLELQMAVNISGAHFVEENFIDTVVSTVDKYNLEHGDLELEITESMTRDPEQHSRICQRLRQVGVHIAIDDFGTGYSSLSVLDKLEVDTLKIDRSFITGLPDDESSKILVQAIMELSLGFGYAVVAEGVETEAQLRHLEELGCPYIQGYYFSKPVTADLIPSLVKQQWHLDKAA